MPPATPHAVTDCVDFASLALAAHVPQLRRYARALTGRQTTGDRYAAAALDAVHADISACTSASSPKVALFRALHQIWASTGHPSDTERDVIPITEAERRALAHLSELTPFSREALLLHTIEQLSIAEVAEVMGSDTAEVRTRIARAQAEMADAASGRVLIIEDEPIIAMNLEMIVADAGHQVTGIARTRAAAVTLGLSRRPDLILADIHLADRSSGIAAAQDLLDQFGDIPTVVITAFPERLLTGAQLEPAFLVSKPFEEARVLTAVSQAMFFSSAMRTNPGLVA